MNVFASQKDHELKRKSHQMIGVQMDPYCTD